MIKKCTRPLTIPKDVNLRTGSRNRTANGTIESPGKDQRSVSPTKSTQRQGPSIGLINGGGVKGGGMQRKGSFAGRSSSKASEKPIMATPYYK